MDEPLKVVLKKNWVAPASIAAGILGVLNYAFYIVSNLQFPIVYLISILFFVTGVFLGIIGLLVGFLEKEGKVPAIAGIALSAFLLSRLLTQLKIQ
jgi:hypothetical protein